MEWITWFIEQHLHINAALLPQPVPMALFAGDGFSEDELKMTTLSQFLKFDTWTPLMASLLVCGIQPPQDCTEIPAGAFGLDGAFITGKEDAFHHARRVLELWNSRENASMRVRPADFVAWCKTKSINTDWLSAVTDDAPRGAEPQSLSVVVESASGGDKAWKETARERANEIIERDRAKSLFPNQLNIADEIAKEFRRDGVMGAAGKPIAGTHIKRHALNGISSAQGKQLSTAMSRSK